MSYNNRERENYQEYNNRNIFKYTTAERMLLMSIDAFDFYDKDGPAPRMKIRCCNYNVNLPQGDRVTAAVDIYIPLGKFLVLAHDIENGVLLRKKRDMAPGLLGNEKKSDQTYFTHFGGTFKPCESKSLSIVDGLGSATFAFLATARPGEIDPKTGLILPQKGSKATASIFVNMPDEQLKELSIIGRIYSEQFIGMLLEEQLRSVRRQREEYRRNPPDSYGGY